MPLDFTKVQDNSSPDATEIWVAKGEDLSTVTDPQVYSRKTYNHNTIHIHNPSSAELDIRVCNYSGQTISSPESHYQSLQGTFTDSRRISVEGKLGFLYFVQNTPGDVWIHILSGQREQR